jgi:hypothetical protein
MNKYHPSWRRAIIYGTRIGVPMPAFSTALAFYDGYRTARLPANLLQAQRDFFGAHTYERVDKPRGEFFHTNWTGRGGRVSSSTYNAYQLLQCFQPPGRPGRTAVVESGMAFSGHGLQAKTSQERRHLPSYEVVDSN